MHGFAVLAADNLVTSACAALAYSQGGRAERLGVIWLSGNLVLGAVANILNLDSPTAHLVEDGLFALGLLPLAVIYVSYWVGMATVIATALFGLEAVYLIDDRPSDPAYAWINNCLWLALALVLLVSGLTNLVRNRRARIGALGANCAAELG
jgi:hypothetical protein